MVLGSEQKRFVILGAAGFIGYHLSKTISDRDDSELLLVDNLIRGKADNDFQELLERKNVQFRQLDLTLIESFNNLFMPNDIVFNLVALNGTQNFYSSASDVLYHSSLPGILAPKKASEARVSKYVYFGSSESYAGGVTLGLIDVPTPEDVPFVIADPKNPRWSYAISKQIGEIACHAMTGRTSFTIFRIHNVYGPRMGFEHVVPDLIRKFLSRNGEVMGVDQTRAFLYVDDAVDMVLQVADDFRSDGETFNIGSNEEIMISSLAETITDLLEINLDIIPVPAPLGSVARRCPTTTKVRQFYHSPLTPLRDGLKKTIEWYKESIISS
jgi:nucleoside-diphosphate-sugar epimerase